MKNLKIDLDLFLELSLQETRGEGECYLNLNDGEFSYIPQSIIEALKDESKFDLLESWEKELAEETEKVVMNYQDSYLYIPLIDDSIITKSMKVFFETLLNEDKKEAASKDIHWGNPFLTFNKTMLNVDELDNFYDFRDEYLKQYLVQWLQGNQINII